MVRQAVADGKELKMKNCYAVIALGMVMSSGACVSNPVVSKVQSIPMNSEVLIGEYGYWKRDCSDRHFDIHIEEYPQDGDIRFEVGSLVIPEDPIVGHAGKCVGQPVKSTRILYIPRTGYTGEDNVKYIVKSTPLLGSTEYDVDIAVK